jgi:hypothetical protein
MKEDPVYVVCNGSGRHQETKLLHCVACKDSYEKIQLRFKTSLLNNRIYTEINLTIRPCTARDSRVFSEILTCEIFK